MLVGYMATVAVVTVAAVFFAGLVMLVIACASCDYSSHDWSKYVDEPEEMISREKFFKWLDGNDPPAPVGDVKGLWARRYCSQCEREVEVDVTFGDQFTDVACIECGDSLDMYFPPTLE